MSTNNDKTNIPAEEASKQVSEEYKLILELAKGRKKILTPGKLKYQGFADVYKGNHGTRSKFGSK